MTSKRSTKSRKIRKVMIQQAKSNTVHNREEDPGVQVRVIADVAEMIKHYWIERGVPTPLEYLEPTPSFAKQIESSDEARWAAAVIIVAEIHGFDATAILKYRSTLAHERLIGRKPVDVVHDMLGARGSCAHDQ